MKYIVCWVAKNGNGECWQRNCKNLEEARKFLKKIKDADMVYKSYLCYIAKV